MQVTILRLEHYPSDWPLPSYATPGSAAVDLRLAGEAVTIPPMGRYLAPTGLAIALPAGTEAQIRPRSGLAIKQGISVVNAPGTIDSDYRGEIRIPLINFDVAPQRIESGDRIAQLVLAEVLQIEWSEATELPSSARGEGGFGSTGR